MPLLVASNSPNLIIYKVYKKYKFIVSIAKNTNRDIDAFKNVQKYRKRKGTHLPPHLDREQICHHLLDSRPQPNVLDPKYYKCLRLLLK